MAAQRHPLMCLINILVFLKMPIAGSTYWNISHGLVAADAKQDEEGMQTMRNLARNMIWMMRSFAVAKEQGVPYPDTEKNVSTNFVR